MKKLLIGVGLLAGLGLGACSLPVTHSGGTGSTAACSGDVTVRWDEDAPCDLTPPQMLTLTYDASFAPAWGGDASLAAADADCADHGGTPDWSAGPAVMSCRGVGY